MVCSLHHLQIFRVSYSLIPVVHQMYVSSSGRYLTMPVDVCFEWSSHLKFDKFHSRFTSWLTPLWDTVKDTFAPVIAMGCVLACCLVLKRVCAGLRVRRKSDLSPSRIRRPTSIRIGLRRARLSHPHRSQRQRKKRCLKTCKHTCKPSWDERFEPFCLPLLHLCFYATIEGCTRSHEEESRFFQTAH